MFDSLKLADLPDIECGILRKPSATRPAIWVVEEKGKRAVVKDFSVNGFFYRNTAGRFLVWREKRAYEKLAGLDGVPRFYGAIDGLAVVVEKIDASNLVEVERGLLKKRRGGGTLPDGLNAKVEKFNETFFGQLRVLVDKIHERGLAHCDLKRTPNILMDEAGKPYVVDWSSYMSERVFSIFPLTLIYRRLLRDDYQAILKLKVNNFPESVSEEVRNAFKNKGLVERILRAVRDALRRLLKKVA